MSLSFLQFRDTLIRQGIFASAHVRLWFPDFNRDSLIRWVAEGKVVKLRNGLYMFPETSRIAGMREVAANEIFAPSYLSLEYALSLYGAIPESVMTYTSVSPRNTARFANAVGRFSYRKLKPRLFWGYEAKEGPHQRRILMATPEKALLDFLYLNPAYKSEADLEELRIDASFVEEVIDRERLAACLERFASKSLAARVTKLLSLYEYA